MTKEKELELENMTTEEREKRFAELTHVVGLPNPEPLQPGVNPIMVSHEDLEEREWLKRSLGVR